MPDRTPVHLFYSYAHADEALRNELDKHLSVLRREGLLAPWHDRDIQAGTEWKKAIDEHLNTASLILLLISPDFLASDYCYDIEMQRAMERHQRGEALVIPVILRPCDWQHAPIGSLQALPRHAKPITTWANKDEAFEHVAQHLQRLLEQHTSSLAPITAQTIQNRERMRQRLQLWYQDFLTDSLQQAAWLELDLTEKPDALANPVSLLVREASLPDRPLPAGTSMIQVYEQANQELLILGEPGAGKSTQLYTVGQYILSQAENDQNVPLPIVFALSSWAIKQGPLETWMAQQLTQIYQVPQQLAQQWVQNYQIIPLLDGLDEMEDTACPHCIQEINRYHQEHLHPLVVCCRSAEYQAATQIARLTLQRAVVVQPLSQEQISATLAKGSRALAGLRAAYKQNIALRELATAPLFLNLLILTYQGTPVRDLPARGDALLEYVLRNYVERMVARKGDGTRYPLNVTTHWLTFLASQMREHKLTTFAIEQLQPDWIERTFHPYYALIVGLGTLQLIALFVVLIYVLALGWTYGLASGLIFGWLAGLVGTRGSGSFAPRDRFQPKILLVESFTWSWQEARLGLVIGLIFGLIVGLIFELVGLIFGLIVGLIFGLILGLIFGLLGGLTLSQNIERLTLPPGKGFRRSLRNGIIFGLLFGLVSVFIGGLGGLSGGVLRGLVDGLLGGVTGGLPSLLIFGFYPVLQHFLLRIFLWRSGVLPFRIITFLEDACARHLLRRIGGNYQFVHRLLLDYFADLDSAVPPTANSAEATSSASSGE